MEEKITETNKKDEDGKVTRICPSCHQPYKTVTGINNWKNLFKKPTTEDWITLVILALLIMAAYAYIQETKLCKETLNNLDTICLQYNQAMSNLSYDNNIIMPELSIGLQLKPNTTTNTTTNAQIGGEKVIVNITVNNNS